MNIYLIQRTDRINWDEHDAVVVCAPDEETAFRISPSEWDKELYPVTKSWHQRSHMRIQLVGTAAPETKQGLILASFNAG